MPRASRYWNVIPLHVEGKNGEAILKSWGITPWGREFGKELVFKGWQRVHLPEGWKITLEEFEMNLVDQHDQVRGAIQDAFRRDSSDDFLSLISGTPAKKVRYRYKPPTLQLFRSLSIRQSFCLGRTGPHSMWVENALGKTLYAIRDVEIPHDKIVEQLPLVRQKIVDWLEEHYPDWQNSNAYWDTFV